MKELPKSAQRYIVLVTVTGITMLLYHTLRMQPDLKVLQGLLFFGILSVITDSLRVPLQRGGFVTVTFAVIYISIIFFGAAVTSFVTIIAQVVSKFITRDKSPWYKVMFNCAQFVICISVSQFLYTYFGGQLGAVNLLEIVPLGASIVGFFLANDVLLSIILGLVHGESPWKIWITNQKWTLPNFFALSFLSVLMGHIYNFTGYWGVSLFFIPLLLARYIFKSYMEIREVYQNTLQALASALDAKDPYTRGHSERVAKYAVEISREMGLSEEQIEIIEHSALLHDIGKIGVSEELLTRIGKLSSDEFDQIKLHPVIGANILMDFENLGDAVGFVKHHHEKYDGTGYPDSIGAQEIPLGARIITLADSFDAMTTDRAYRRKMSLEQALDEIDRCAGSQFDPEIVAAFMRCWEHKSGILFSDSLLEAAPTSDR